MKNISLLLLKVGNANSGNWESPGNPRYAHNSRKPSKESVVISVDTDSWRGKTAEIIIKRELNRLQKNTPNVIEILNNSPVKISITTDIDIKKSSGIYEDGLIRMHPKGSNFPGKYFIGNFNVDSSVEGVFRHELGHHIDHVTNIADGKFTAAIFEGMKKQNLDPSKTKERRKYISDIISSYGSINMGEAFAEAFTAYTHSKYNEKGRPRLPISVEKVFDELLKVKEKSLAEYLIEVKGGSGSGNFGHAGRPGQIGGSGGGGGTLRESRNPFSEAIETLRKPESHPNIKLWSEARKDMHDFAKSKDGQKREEAILTVGKKNMRIKGKKHEVTLPTSLLQKIDYLIHNHDNGSAPSPQDIALFMSCDKMNRMEVATANGVIFSLTKKTMSRSSPKERFKTKVKILKSWIEEQDKMIPIFQKKVDKGMDGTKAFIKLSEEVNVIMAEKLGYKYEKKAYTEMKSKSSKIEYYEIGKDEEVFILDDSWIHQNPFKEKAKSLSKAIFEKARR